MAKLEWRIVPREKGRKFAIQSRPDESQSWDTAPWRFDSEEDANAMIRMKRALETPYVIYRCPYGHTRGEADYADKMIGMPTCPSDVCALREGSVFLERIEVTPVRDDTFGSMREVREAMFPSLCPQCGKPKDEAKSDFESITLGQRKCQCGETWIEDV